MLKMTKILSSTTPRWGQSYKKDYKFSKDKVAIIT